MSIWINIGFGGRERPASRKHLKALEQKMAKTIDELNALKGDFDAAMTRVNEDTAAFNTSILALKGQVAALEAQLGETTPEVQAIIDDLRATIRGIDPDPSNPPVNPEEPPAEPTT